MQDTTHPNHSASLKRSLFHSSWRSTRFYRLSYSEIVDIEKSPTHYPCDNCQNIRVILFSIRSDDGNPSSVNIKQLCGSIWKAFGRLLEEIYVTWTQFRKKRDKIATLHEDDQDLAYGTWRRCHNFLRRCQSIQEMTSGSFVTTSK
ncbi:hypothetical protein Tco_0953554 [Tanacetum coccineum]|uniref:Uncharacterized protein n=1 Tax=Tanacetum coccineum TaxID=301880 RepID=A0ABQ5E174_9ASTR